MTARRQELKQRLQTLLTWLRNNPDGSRTLTAAQIREVFELGKRVGHHRGYQDGNFDHGQSWGDRSDYREEEYVKGRELDTTEDDHPEIIDPVP